MSFQPTKEVEQRSPLDGSFWQKYAVSKNGFLSAKTPLKKLSNSSYEPWEILIHSLPELLQDGILRLEVTQLPVLSTDHLKGEQEWRRAYVILSFLAHAYIWGGDTASEVLPPAITVPLLEVSKHLELPPVATYAALNLWNFTSSSPTHSFADLDALQALHTFTGTLSESWFYTVSVAIECAAAPIMPMMLNALEAVKIRDLPIITHNLDELRSKIHIMGTLLDRMHEHCDPHIFYHSIRPFLAGSKNMAAAGLPRGVFYDEGDAKGRWMQLRGGSNGQSSLIQFLDVVLGVEHKSSGDIAPEGKTSSEETRLNFHDEVRGYMPGPHRRFLEHVSGMESLKSVAMGPTTTDEERALKSAFEAATRALAEFRNKHLSIVARYIVLPSRQAYLGKRSNLGSCSSEGRRGRRGHTELTGTGGTALLPFLKQSRDETLHAGETSLAR